MAVPMSTTMDFKEQLQFPIKLIVIRIVIHIKHRDTYRLWKKCIVTPLLSTLFLLYRGGQFYWWRKQEYLGKTTDLSLSH